MNITDILNKDLKTSCRWWASFDLFRRLLFITVVVIFSTTWPLYMQVSINLYYYRGIITLFFYYYSVYVVGSALLQHLCLLYIRMCSAIRFKESQYQRGRSLVKPDIDIGSLPQRKWCRSTVTGTVAASDSLHICSHLLDIQSYSSSLV